MEKNIQHVIDKAEAIDRKLLGFEGVLNFMNLGLETLHYDEESYEINTVLSLYAGIRALRKNELAELHGILEQMKN